MQLHYVGHFGATLRISMAETSMPKLAAQDTPRFWKTARPIRGRRDCLFVATTKHLLELDLARDRQGGPCFTVLGRLSNAARQCLNGDAERDMASGIVFYFDPNWIGSVVEVDSMPAGLKRSEVFGGLADVFIGQDACGQVQELAH